LTNYSAIWTALVAAFALVRRDPELSRPEHRRIREVLLQRWGKRLRLARVG